MSEEYTNELRHRNSTQVPKKIFFYWGNPVMSWLRYMTLHSFRKLNPDWEMELHVSHIDLRDKCWKDSNEQDFYAYKGKNYLPEVEKLGVTIKECPAFVEGASPPHNSDLFRWNELATGGGIYSDMDILFVKPIDILYEQIKNYRYGLCIDEEGNYLIGFMFSSGNNCFFKHVFNSSKLSFNRNVYQSAGTVGITRILQDLGVSRVHRVRTYKEGLLHMNLENVYPFRWNQQRDFFHVCHTELPKETIGIHWFAGHPEAQAFNNNVNPDTLDSYNNTMSYWLKQLQ